jgi:tetratricopeptide (TPR) repeat protein
MCPILKKLTNKLKPYREVTRLIVEIRNSKKGKDARILEHLLSFAEYQFGKGVATKHYRERQDGDRISNWIVEIEILNEIITTSADLYNQNKSLSSTDRDNMAFPYLKRSLSILNPWVINLDPDSSYGVDSFSKDQIKRLLDELIYTEQNMARVTGDRRQFDAAEGHCQRCLAYSRRYELEGEEKITSIFKGLQTCCALQERQGNYVDALTFAEECYNLVVEAYDPVHAQVQEAARLLIHILISKGDLFDAERYAQVTYGNLRDKKNGINQESEAVAEGAYNLANVIYQQKGDLIKAEELARESLRIRSLIFGSVSDHQHYNDHYSVGISCNLVANILRRQSKLGDETRRLYDRFLAISILINGPDGPNTAIVNESLGMFHHELAHKQATLNVQQAQLLLAKSHFEEALRIRSKMYGPTHPETVVTASRLATVSGMLSKIPSA